MIIITHVLQIKIIQANNDFKKHTQNVVEMKKDLESIFRFYTIHIHSREYSFCSGD